MKLRCISRFTLVDKKTGLDVQTFDDVDYGKEEDVYEVDDKTGEELLATGNFVQVE